METDSDVNRYWRDDIGKPVKKRKNATPGRLGRTLACRYLPGNHIIGVRPEAGTQLRNRAFHGISTVFALTGGRKGYL